MGDGIIANTFKSNMINKFIFNKYNICFMRSNNIPNFEYCVFVCLFVFAALRPKSTAMVIAGRSVHLSTLFPGQA